MDTNDICTIIELNGIGMKPHAIGEVIRRARRHNRMAGTACNRNLSDREKSADKTNEDRIMALIRENAVDKVPVKFGGDPRGYTVKVMLPNGHSNTWGGPEDGWGI